MSSRFSVGALIGDTPTFIQSDILTGSQWSDSGLPSNHNPVTFDFAVDVCLMDNSGLQRFDFKKADFASLKQALMLIPLSTGIDNMSTPLRILIPSGRVLE